MEYNYEDCLKFVRKKLRLNLFHYQEQMLKAFCEGKEVRSARCSGRTYVAQAFGKYVASLYDVNDYSKDPDIIVPYHCALEVGLTNQDLIDRERSRLSTEVFNREYLCI